MQRFLSYHLYNKINILSIIVMNSTLRWVVAIVGWIVLLIIFGIWKSLDKEIGTSIIVGGIRGGLLGGGVFFLYQWAKSNPVRKDIVNNNDATKEKEIPHPSINADNFEKMAAEGMGDEKFELDENKIYEKISEEIDQNTLDKGLWLKFFTESDGNKEKTKIRYIKERFKVLKNKEVENFQLSIKKQQEAERKILANSDLVRAVRDGNVAKARHLLDEGVRPIGVDEYKNLLLEIAGGNKDKIMADLIKTYRKKLNLIY